MPLPNKITILEMLKFRESNDGKDAIAVINPDGTLIGGPTVAISSSATLYAVVNTTAAGQASVALDTGSKWIGLATVYIGGPTIFAVVNTAAAGNTNALATLLSGPNQIGSVTISNNPTLGAGSNYVGLASVNIGGTLPALTAGTAYIGLASISGNVVNSAGANYIGLASVNIGGTLPALTAGSAFIGLVSTASIVGLVEVKRAKTIEILPFNHQASGFATLVVPTGNWYVTNLLVGSNANAMFNLLSGPTYLIGNASIGMSFATQSGMIQTGTIDAPAYKSLAANAGIVLKSNSTVAFTGSISYYVE